MNYVIIGNGIAGIKAAEAIRQFDPTGDITMIADETFLPYCRPMISHLLEGSIQSGKLSIRGPKFYDNFNIKPVLGNRVSGIDVENRRVFIKNKKAYPFDKLLIATGADPRPIKADGLDLENIFFMRTEAHIRQMLKIMPKAKSALVLGGGLVGFKAACGLLCRGIKVTMLISSDYPLSMQVDKKAGEMILKELAAKGLKVMVKETAVGFKGDKRVKSACLTDGTKINCDMVVVGKGVKPAVDFVPRDKINVDLGILVNHLLETNIPGIYAAGDVAESIDIARKERWVNAIWPEAAAQGRIAGMNMTGQKVVYKGSLSRNVIRVFGLDIMTGGLVNPPSGSNYEIISHNDCRLKTYRKLVFRSDKLVGMIMVNAVEQGGILVSLIQSEMPVKIPKEFLLDRSFNFRQLIR